MVSGKMGPKIGQTSPIAHYAVLCCAVLFFFSAGQLTQHEEGAAWREARWAPGQNDSGTGSLHVLPAIADA